MERLIKKYLRTRDLNPLKELYFAKCANNIEEYDFWLLFIENFIKTVEKIIK